MPQMKALYNVIEYIFDRNASLLPAYFIVTEIQKDYPDNNHWPHWVGVYIKENICMSLFLNNYLKSGFNML